MRPHWSLDRTTVAARRIALALVAATLAALSLTSGILAMDEVAIQNCDDSVHAGFVTAYDPPTGGYVVDAVTLSGVAAACDGMTFSVTLADGTNHPLGSATYTDPAGPDGQVDPNLGDRQLVRLHTGSTGSAQRR